MKNLKMYEPADKMITLIKDNYSVLQALGSFGINLGFGDKTVQETCDYNGVDTYTFLAVVNFTINDFTNFEDDEQISVPTLLHYLEASHAYYLDFQLPFIRRELEESLGKDDHLGHLIMRLYDEYAQEIRRHMKYEENSFPLRSVATRRQTHERLQHRDLLQASRTDRQETARGQAHDY